MSYKSPSRRLKKETQKKLNLIPILDSVFIFIFFLLMTAEFLKVSEIASAAPIISSDTPPPPPKREPLNLTIEIKKNALYLLTGNNNRVYKKIDAKNINEYDLEDLHSTLLNLKKRYPKERDVVLIPEIDIPYEKLVAIMDSIRMIRPSDEAIYTQDSSGMDQKVQSLFDAIVFGNVN